jgi:hypothetical protein
VKSRFSLIVTETGRQREHCEEQPDAVVRLVSRTNHTATGIAAMRTAMIA